MLFGLCLRPEITNAQTSRDNPDFSGRHEDVSGQGVAELSTSGYPVLDEPIPDDSHEAGKPKPAAVFEVVVNSKGGHSIPSGNHSVDHNAVRLNLTDNIGPMPKPDGNIFSPAVWPAVPHRPKPRIGLTGKAVMNFLLPSLSRAGQVDFMALLQKRLNDCVEEGVDSVGAAQRIPPGKKDSHDLYLSGKVLRQKIGVHSKLLVPFGCPSLILTLSMNSSLWLMP